MCGGEGDEGYGRGKRGRKGVLCFGGVDGLCVVGEDGSKEESGRGRIEWRGLGDCEVGLEGVERGKDIGKV